MQMERRQAIELRAGGTKSARTLSGHAAVFDSPSEDLGGFVEYVRRGAFADSLKSNRADPVALVGHVGHLILGRRSAGTLPLEEDERGLAFKIILPETTTGNDIYTSVERA